VKALVHAPVLQGFLAPILVVLLTMIARDRVVMGAHRNGWFDTTFGFMAAAVTVTVAIALIIVTLVG
jgi:Mn2+/Fe2+ NRAMP family transporter